MLYDANNMALSFLTCRTLPLARLRRFSHNLYKSYRRVSYSPSFNVYCLGKQAQAVQAVEQASSQPTAGARSQSVTVGAVMFLQVYVY